MLNRFGETPNHNQLESEQDKPAIEKISQKIFNKKISPEQFENELSIPNKKINARISPETLNAQQIDDTTSFLSLRLDLVYQGKQIIGHVELCFSKDKNEPPYLEIEERRLHETGQGLGLDLECVIEAFCRKHKIWTIKNEASSDPEINQIGAYVWACYGYEFDDPETDLPILRDQLIDFAEKNGVTIATDITDINALTRPIHFAKLQGSDNKGQPVAIGKKFLTETKICWKGRRDLALNSPGTKDYIEYLKERGQEDLVKEYYIT